MKSDLTTGFLNFNHRHRLIPRRKRTLLAVSGGVDSMVMCHLFHSLGFAFAIAHCNFQLRGKQSDADEQFVKEVANQLGVQFFVKRFDTKAYALENKLSIQMAARELRYRWFEEVMIAEKFQVLVTGHHLNDAVETVLLNITRGTGIRGLRGIPVRNGKVVRPLLFARKEELLEYADFHHISFREDESNNEDAYQRNKIRHAVVPVLKELNPSFEKAVQVLVGHSEQAVRVYEKQQARLLKKLLIKQPSRILLPIELLKDDDAVRDLLFTALKPYGFNETQVKELILSRDGIPGTQYFSDTHRIVRDRKVFILSSRQTTQHAQHLIGAECNNQSFSVGQLVFERTAAPAKFKADKNVCWLNASSLEFPLLLRPWKQGDYFYPFGMGMKKKKLSKFFKDEKLSLIDKEAVWVLESNKRIVWVVGFRCDERFRVKDPNSVLKVTLQQQESPR